LQLDPYSLSLRVKVVMWYFDHQLLLCGVF